MNSACIDGWLISMFGSIVIYFFFLREHCRINSTLISAIWLIENFGTYICPEKTRKSWKIYSQHKAQFWEQHESVISPQSIHIKWMKAEARRKIEKSEEGDCCSGYILLVCYVRVEVNWNRYWMLWDNAHVKACWYG